MFVSQRKLRAPAQLHRLVESIQRYDPIPPVLLSEDDDGSVQIEDGHHRVTAYWLAGRHTLWPDEYTLTARRGVPAAVRPHLRSDRTRPRTRCRLAVRPSALW